MQGCTWGTVSRQNIRNWRAYTWVVQPLFRHSQIPVIGAPEGGSPLCGLTAQNVAALAHIPLPLFCAEMNCLHCQMYRYIKISIGKSEFCQ